MSFMLVQILMIWPYTHQTRVVHLGLLALLHKFEVEAVGCSAWPRDPRLMSDLAVGDEESPEDELLDLLTSHRTDSRHTS